MKSLRYLLVLTVCLYQNSVEATDLFLKTIAEPVINSNEDCKALTPKQFTGASFEVTPGGHKDQNFETQLGYMLSLPNSKNSGLSFVGCAEGLPNSSSERERSCEDSFQLFISKQPLSNYSAKIPNWSATEKDEENAASIKIYGGKDWRDDIGLVDVIQVRTERGQVIEWKTCMHHEKDGKDCIPPILTAIKELNNILDNYVLVPRTALVVEEVTYPNKCPLENRTHLTPEQLIELQRCRVKKGLTLKEKKISDVYVFQEKNVDRRNHRLRCGIAILERAVQVLREF